MVVHKKHGKKQTEISKLTVTPQSTVSDQIDNFRKCGIGGLRRRHGGGNLGYLTDSQRDQVISYMESETLTSRQINTYISRNFGKSYHPFAMPKFLRSLGFSRITPRKRHYKSNKTKQEEWKADFKKRPKNIWIRDTKSSSKTKQ